MKPLLTLITLFIAASCWAQTGRIVGVVVDRGTDEPVAFAAIRIFKSDTLKASAVADMEGRFESGALAPGDYRVEVASAGYQPGVQQASIGADGQHIINVPMQPDLQYRQAPEPLNRWVLIEDPVTGRARCENARQSATHYMPANSLKVVADGNIRYFPNCFAR